ncbi:unnamed protein product [Vitrella brassicaformis CCMP3155]|uniref:START domain-containing protein n=1 Tax=Vitrella brassicaformis (strain CCMP3155) TaxID=1169540 RepID=A0A0G4GN04_VITBC|nr:unnamed protein product [Vitrella brassicaformis CCMP3155]|eukprot:CEM31580.1 unnamed protein product [Vitrella brassicaformis CCMP3155]
MPSVTSSVAVADDAKYAELLKRLPAESHRKLTSLRRPDSSAVEVFEGSDDAAGRVEVFAKGTIASPPEVLWAVNCDSDHRKTWDRNAAQLETFTLPSSGEKVVYWRMPFPGPFNDRDYVYTQRCVRVKGPHHNSETFLVVNQASPDASDVKPPKDGVTRVSEYMNVIAITPDPDHPSRSSSFSSFYVEGQTQGVPSIIRRWGASFVLPKSLERMIDACQTYPESRLSLMQQPRADPGADEKTREAARLPSWAGVDIVRGQLRGWVSEGMERVLARVRPTASSVREVMGRMAVGSDGRWFGEVWSAVQMAARKEGSWL